MNLIRVHLDTDFGSDTDDACALAMLLGWPDVEIVGITTTIDPGGIRAGFVARCLELAGRTGIPVGSPRSSVSRPGVYRPLMFKSTVKQHLFASDEKKWCVPTVWPAAVEAAAVN